METLGYNWLLLETQNIGNAGNPAIDEFARSHQRRMQMVEILEADRDDDR